jgi:prefoldin subunit 5
VDEAVTNIEKRLEFIKNKTDGLDDQIKKLEKAQADGRQKIEVITQIVRRQMQAAAQAQASQQPQK